MIRMALAACLAALCASSVWAQHPKLYDKAAAFFDDSAVRDIRLYFDDPKWYDTLYNAHRNERETGDPYFPCRFQYGNLVLNKIGVRFKGGASFARNGVKKPFKLDFNEYDAQADFLGLTKLNLNNNDLQPDFMREKLFSDFAGKFVTSRRSVHVRLYVNDVYYGLYIAMEQTDKRMMESRFGKLEDGNLFEAPEAPALPGGPLGRPDLTWRGPDPASYRGIYELETNKEANDYSGLIEFIDILNNTPTANLPARLEAVCDVEDTLLWLAFNNLFVNLDSYLGAGAEYYLYDRSRDGRFIYTQWDLNESFGTTGDGTERIANPFALDVFWLPTFGGGGNTTRPLLTKLWAVDVYKRLYLRSFARLLREGFNPDTFSPRVTQLASLIREHVYADSNKTTTNEQFETTLNNQTTITFSGGPGGSASITVYGVNQFIRERYNYLRAWLNSQALPSDVRLNELVNTGAYKDNAGDADPWVELHNLGPGPVTLSNFYLTDDTANPTKWQLPAKTLADGDYLILWLDGETSEGDTHASFRLQSVGGKLFLYQAQTQLDTVSYPTLATGQSYIRLGSYGNQWAANYQPTPAVANPAAGSSTNKPPTTGTGQLLINEIMADNDDVYPDPDEAGAFNDWFEVFNPGTTAVEMSGMYITDNPANPTKWKVPAGVAVPARGYLVFIADDQTAQGKLHTNFNLSKDGEALYLFQSDGQTLIDSYTFGLQQSDVSIGRVTDGDGAWSIFNPATPGAPNMAAYANFVTNAANFLAAPLAPSSIASLFGENLATNTVSATSTPLPTTLGGVTVSVTDRANVTRDAPLFFVSGGQVNFQLPAETAKGRAKLNLRRQDGTTVTGDILIDSVAPGLFSVSATGQGIGTIVALRISANGTQTYLPTFSYDAAQQRFIAVPLSLGAETDRVYLILFATGIRGVEKLDDVSVEVGGAKVPVTFAGPQGNLIGLDQVNIGPLPRSLAGKGAVNLALEADKRGANRVTITIQ